MTVTKIELGRRLFYDTRLSGSSTFSCGTCHQQSRAFTDGRARAIGSTGALHARSTMSLTNVAYNSSYGWADPSLSTLEEQMLVPMFNDHPIELGVLGREDEIVSRFAADVKDFRHAFPTDRSPVNLPNIVKAIAAFERTLVSGDSPLDRYLYRDDKSALSPAALRGLNLFSSNRLGCVQCHETFNLSGPVVFAAGPTRPPPPLFHNTGLYDVDGNGRYPESDLGLFQRTRRSADMGRFRAPTLRNVSVTAPFMHDGSIPTLEAVIDHYASGGQRSPFVSNRLRGFRLTADEKTEMIAFLDSLTDRAFLTNPSFGPPAR